MSPTADQIKLFLDTLLCGKPLPVELEQPYATFIGRLTNTSCDPHYLKRYFKMESRAISEIASILETAVHEQTSPSYTPAGHPYFVRHPELCTWDAENVLIALSRICRYNGAVDISVLRHTLNCMVIIEETRGTTGAECATREECLAVFLHDWPEAFLLDVATGTKNISPLYRKWEAAWSDMFYVAHGMSTDKHITFVNQIDVLALCGETHNRLPSIFVDACEIANRQNLGSDEIEAAVIAVKKLDDALLDIRPDELVKKMHARYRQLWPSA